MNMRATEPRTKKPITLPWWAVLCWMVACVPIVWLIDRIGRIDLALPTLYSIGMLGVAITLQWQLRRHLWFWITMTVIAALHVLLILFVPWGTKWVTAFVVVPIGLADLYAMLAVLSVVRKFMGQETARNSVPSSCAADD
jgi:hypothetical protein